MITVIKSIFWSHLRQCRIHLFLFAAAAIAFSVFISQYKYILNPNLFLDHNSKQTIMILAIIIEIFGLSAFIISQLNTSRNLAIPEYLYTKPVSSRLLAGTYLGTTIAGMTAVHLITALIYRMIGHINWPVLMPLIILITFTLAIYVIFWALSEVPVIMCMAIITAGYFIFNWGTNYLSGNKKSFADMPIFEFICIVIFWILATVICIVSIKHARCNEYLSSKRFRQWIREHLTILLPNTNIHLKKPDSAYFWMLCRTRAWILPLITILGLAISLAVFILSPESDIKSRRITAFLIDFAMLNLMFIYPCIGTMIITASESRGSGFSYAIAAHPISNRSILLTMLKALLISCTAAWIIYFSGLVLISAWLKTTCFIWDCGLFTINPAHIAMALIYSWTIAGLTGSVVLYAQKWLLKVICIILVALPCMIIISVYFGGDTAQELLIKCLIWIFAIVSISASTWFFRYLYKLNRISGLYVICCILGYLIFSSIYLYIKPCANATETAWRLGLSVLPVMPFASAPLALYCNRHR